MSDLIGKIYPIVVVLGVDTHDLGVTQGRQVDWLPGVDPTQIHEPLKGEQGDGGILPPQAACRH